MTEISKVVNELWKTWTPRDVVKFIDKPTEDQITLVALEYDALGPSIPATDALIRNLANYLFARSIIFYGEMCYNKVNMEAKC